MPLTPDQAELFGVIAECILYGLYCAMFVSSLVILRLDGGRKGVTSSGAKLLIITAVYLFLMVTTHVIIDISRVHSAFFVDLHGPLAFYVDWSEWRSVLRVVLFVAELIALDALMLHRLYIIWSKNPWVVILPGLTLIGTIVACTGICVGFATSPTGSNLFVSTTGKWITAGFSLTLATNLQAVCLIAYRLVRRDREIAAMGASGVSGLMRVLVVIVEGAGIYCLVNLITLVFLLAQNAANFTTLAMASPVTGISFSLIVLRVGWARAASNFAGTYSRSNAPAPSTGDSFALRVRVTRDRHDDRDMSNVHLDKSADFVHAA